TKLHDHVSIRDLFVRCRMCALVASLVLPLELLQVFMLGKRRRRLPGLPQVVVLPREGQSRSRESR
ncbi:hypothetical protein LSAT2_032136, partial [Lamellibrachia satsuma]